MLLEMAHRTANLLPVVAVPICPFAVFIALQYEKAGICVNLDFAWIGPLRATVFAFKAIRFSCARVEPLSAGKTPTPARATTRLRL